MSMSPKASLMLAMNPPNVGESAVLTYSRNSMLPTASSGSARTTVRMRSMASSLFSSNDAPAVPSFPIRFRMES